MAAFVLTNVNVLLDEDDWTSQTVSVRQDAQTRMARSTTMGSGGFEEFKPSLRSFTTGAACQADYATATAIGNKLTHTALGAQKVLTLLPQGGATVGDPAFVHRGVLSKIQALTNPIGEVAGFDLTLTGDTASAFGWVGANLASRTTTGFTGAAVAQTGPTASQRLYCSLHVTAAAGTNLVVTVQSDDNAGFTTPTTRITFATMSAVGSQYLNVAGNLSTETHWRIVATIATGTFTFGAYFAVA
jgi:hypothetical protein